MSTSCGELGIMYLNMNDNPSIPTNHARAYQLIQQSLSINQKEAVALLGMAMCCICDDIPEVQNIESDERVEKFRYYCKQAMKYDNGMVGHQAWEALNQFEKSMQEAQSESSGSGCFITTAVCDTFGKTDDCYELVMFRDFRDKWLALQIDGKSLINEYYVVAPKIVLAINKLSNAKEIYQEIWDNYLAKCLQYIEQGQQMACKEKYVDMVNCLRKKYLDNKDE